MPGAKMLINTTQLKTAVLAYLMEQSSGLLIELLDELVMHGGFDDVNEIVHTIDLELRTIKSWTNFFNRLVARRTNKSELVFAMQNRNKSIDGDIYNTVVYDLINSVLSFATKYASSKWDSISKQSRTIVRMDYH